jgi:hypothetical protein
MLDVDDLEQLVRKHKNRDALDIPIFLKRMWEYQIRTKRVGGGRLVTVQAIVKN